MSESYAIGQDIGKLQIMIETLQTRLDKIEGKTIVESKTRAQESVSRVMQEVPESFVSLESVERVADEKYELNLPAGKQLTFRCDFFADYEHLIQCFVYPVSSRIPTEVIWKNRLWQGGDAVKPVILAPRPEDRLLVFVSEHKACYPASQNCASRPWLTNYIRLQSESPTYVDIAWSESSQGTARNAGLVIFL
jgi:hypothetical protein